MVRIESNGARISAASPQAYLNRLVALAPIGDATKKHFDTTSLLQGHRETPRMEILCPIQRILRHPKLARLGMLMLAITLTSGLASAESPEPNSRLATYQTPAGDGYFAISVTPQLNQQQLDSVTKGPRSVVVVVDTSASQSGYYRNQTLDAVRSVLAGLDPEVAVSIVAVDVKATPLSDRFAKPTSDTTTKAIKNLANRLPLGNTDLAAALRTADAMLAPQSGHRSMVYVGDGSSIGDVLDAEAFGKIADSLRSNQIAVHSLAIGPTTNVQLLASIANQTGGVTLIQSDDSKATPQQMGTMLADAASHSPLWIQSATLPEGFISAHGDRLPPLRTDRDSVLIGRFEGDTAGPLVVRTVAGDQQVDLTWDLEAEPSNPDFAFLPSLVTQSNDTNGLYLATAGSGYLRETARVMTENADQLAKAGALALKRGELKGAAAVAEMALSIDPNNPQALTVSNLASDQTKLTAQIVDAEGSGLLDPQAPGIRPDPLEAPSVLMDVVEAERAQAVGRTRAEVRAQLKAARQRLSQDPTGVAASLKILLDSVQAEPDLDVRVRDELAAQIVSAIQVAGRSEVRYSETQERQQEIKAQAATTERLLQETFRHEARVKTLVDQFSSLMRENRTSEAVFEVAPQVEELEPDTVISNAMKTQGHMVHNYRRWKKAQSMRQRNFVDSLLLNEEAFVPFVDDPPLQYTDAETWQRMSRRRLDRYGAIELTGNNAAERRIYKALNDDTELKFIDEPLENVVDILKQKHSIPIVIDLRALDDLGLTPDIPVTKNLESVSLRSGLRLLLQDLDLTYMIKDEVLQITTPDAAETNLVTKVYPVGDLVVPVIQLGGGGMGGGMGGGGMFAVPDEVRLSEKATSTQTAATPATTETESENTPLVVELNQLIKVEPSEGQTEAEAWDQYFADLSFADDRQRAIHDSRLRMTIRQGLRRAEKADEAGDAEKTKLEFQRICDIVGAALRQGHAQSWMYHGLALALQGTGADQSEVERAVLSAADFAETTDDLLNVARHMNQMNMQARAIELCKKAAQLDPYKSEAYLMGLGIARQTDDLAGISWACAGVLRQAWPESLQHIEDKARLTARSTYQRLLEEGRVMEAKQFENSVSDSVVRDCVVRVSWTGQADIDLLVEEPSGTVCSLQSPRSAGGGVLLGDSFSGDEPSVAGYSESYVCPEGFSGEYRILLRRVWGNVSTGHVTVDVITDVGRPEQHYFRRQIPLTEQNALITFQVQDGRRKQPVAEAKLVDLREQQAKINRNILAQQSAGAPVDLRSAADYYRDLALSGGNRGRNPFLRNGAVGFRPDITLLPEGASLQVLGIISADRRYVRITPGPFFSQIGDVTTFNFVTGDEGTGTGGGGDAFGGGGVGGGGQL